MSLLVVLCLSVGRPVSMSLLVVLCLSVGRPVSMSLLVVLCLSDLCGDGGYPCPL